MYYSRITSQACLKEMDKNIINNNTYTVQIVSMLNTKMKINEFKYEIASSTSLCESYHKLIIISGDISMGKSYYWDTL